MADDPTADFPLLTPMLVMRFDKFKAQGHIPRSNEAEAKELLEKFDAAASDQITVFISHQWWQSHHPDYTEGVNAHLKFRTVIHGVEQLIAKFGLDQRQVCLWIDWFSISQDDEALKLLAVRSLVKYATLCAFMLIPCKETPFSSERPGDLPGYGPRAWCRCEWMIFSLWAEMQVVRPELMRGGQRVLNNRIVVAAGRAAEIGMVEGWVRALTQLYAVSLAGACGYKWTRVGAVKPKSGRAIRNAKLAKALKSTTEFSNAAWEEFGGMCGYGIDDDGDERLLRKSDFIQSGTSYFTPAPERICHYQEVSFRDGNDLPDAGDLSLEEDRTNIRDLQEQMINAYVPTMIRNQCAGGAGAVINMGYRMVRDAHVPQLVKALRQMGLNTPGLKWKRVEEASIGGVCICDKCEIECIEVWECKECEERETAGEGSGFVLCKKCYASLRSGDRSVLHNGGHTFEFQELGHGEGEVQSEALASALQDKMAFTRQELDSFKLPTLSYYLGQGSSSTTSYIRAEGTCYRPAHNSLTLTACKLTVAGYKQLAAFLADDSTLQELEMSSCFNTLKEGQVRSVQWNNGISVGAFDTEGAAALVEGLKTNTGLLRLDFSYNKTTSSAWHVALAQAKMSQRHSLSVILHSECTIALTIESFCQALGTHPTLEVLDLRGNAMTDEGASALGAMLATNATLKELSLAENCIMSKGATALAGALKNNPALLVLELNENPVDDQGATAIAQALVERTALTGRSIKKMGITMEKSMTDAGREVLRKAAEEAGVELDGSGGYDDSDDEEASDGKRDTGSSSEWSTEEEEEV